MKGKMRAGEEQREEGGGKRREMAPKLNFLNV